MKYTLLALVCMSHLHCGRPTQENTAKYFTRERTDCDFRENQSNKYYRLILANDNNAAGRCSYHFDFKNYSDSEKVEMIEELLSYEGDVSLCSVKPACYNILTSQIVPAQIDVYTTQVEALFIINHIILSDPYNFSSFPILRSRDGTSVEAVSGPLIKKAYILYRQWLAQVKKSGLENMISKGILPLGSDADVHWL